MQARSAATLDKIHAAAEALIARRGIGSLTMDAVAGVAGISKGGVLHHFRSKDALVTSLVLRRLQGLQDQLAAEISAQPPAGANPTLRGMIAHGNRHFGKDDAFPRALLLAAVENSQSLEAFRRMLAGTMAEVRRESRHADGCTGLLFAVIGMLMAQTLGFADIAPAEASRIFAALDLLVPVAEEGGAD